MLYERRTDGGEWERQFEKAAADEGAAPRLELAATAGGQVLFGGTDGRTALLVNRGESAASFVEATIPILQQVTGGVLVPGGMMLAGHQVLPSHDQQAFTLSVSNDLIPKNSDPIPSGLHVQAMTRERSGTIRAIVSMLTGDVVLVRVVGSPSWIGETVEGPRADRQFLNFVRGSEGEASYLIALDGLYGATSTLS